MMDSPMDVVARRLERLERENRRLKGAGTALVLGLVAILLMGQALPKGRTVEAEKFVLKDKAGKIRAVLGEGPDDERGLIVYDQNQRPRAMVAMDQNDEPMVRLVNEAGVDRVFLYPSIGVRVQGDGPSASLGVPYGNEPTLQLTDKDGWTRAALVLTATNTAPILKFLDPRGNTRAWIGAMADGKAQLLMMGRPPQSQPGQAVDLSRPTVIGHAALEVNADSTMSLRFMRGGIIWKAP